MNQKHFTILDDFAMRDLTGSPADDLYEIVTERAGRSFIITSDRSTEHWYPLFPNPVVAESVLDRIINTARPNGSSPGSATDPPNDRSRIAEPSTIWGEAQNDPPVDYSNVDA